MTRKFELETSLWSTVTRSFVCLKMWKKLKINNRQRNCIPDHPTSNFLPRCSCVPFGTVDRKKTPGLRGLYLMYFIIANKSV